MKYSVLLAILLAGLSSACRSTEGTESAHELRVLSYNIHHGEGLDGVVDLARIAEVLRAQSPGLVALQEVDRQAARTGSVDQVRELASLTGMNSAFAKFMNFQGGVYGLAILSAYPIQRSWSIELPPGPHEPRSALAVQVEVPTLGPLTFVCLHFDWLADDSARQAQARALISALDTIEMPVVIAGDFNDTPDSPTMLRLREVFTNVEKPPEDRLTFSSSEPQREIDYIMYRPALRFAAEARVLDEPLASDHRPLLASLRPR